MHLNTLLQVGCRCSHQCGNDSCPGMTHCWMTVGYQLLAHVKLDSSYMFLNLQLLCLLTHVNLSDLFTVLCLLHDV